jgi:Ca2+-binding RTX toxin-like protein
VKAFERRAGVGLVVLGAAIATAFPTVVIGGDQQPACNGVEATVTGTPGDDTFLRGTPGLDVMVGGGGDDYLQGGDGDDVICGGRGDDRVVAGYGTDRLLGGGGRDVMQGDEGKDVIRGQMGADNFAGYTGEDRCNGGSPHPDLSQRPPGGPYNFDKGSCEVLKSARRIAEID